LAVPELDSQLDRCDYRHTFRCTRYHVCFARAYLRNLDACDLRRPISLVL